MAILVASCSARNDAEAAARDSALRADSIRNAKEDSIKNLTFTIFGVKVHYDSMAAIKDLAEAGILKCDTIHEEDGEFISAVVEFAGVKFGMNRNFVFMTSRHDMEAIDSLVNKICEYYDDLYIDCEGSDEPDEYSYYHWNLYDTLPDRPYIRIRPLHSDEGGLTMMWKPNY